MKKILIMLFVLFFCSSQEEKEDAYFIVNLKHETYTLGNNIFKSNITSLGTNITLGLYDRNEFNKRQKEIAQQKKEGKYTSYHSWGGKRIPKTLTFNIKSKKKKVISHCDIHEDNLRIVDYNWLIRNSWKENNPNIVFKDLYFLFKIDKDKYAKYKVKRTVIAY